MDPVGVSENPILRQYMRLLYLNLDVLSNTLNLLSMVAKVWIIVLLGPQLPDREGDEPFTTVDHKGDTNDHRD